MTNFARQLRQHQTDTEQKIWQVLRNRQFLNLKFRRQHRIGPYIVDFCCLEKKLVIEIDGGQHAEQKNKDILRTSYLNQAGFSVVRFWDHEVLKNVNAVKEEILRNVNLPSPQPSP